MLEDVEVGVNPIVGDRLGPQQLVQVLPLTLEPVADVLLSGDDADKLVDDVQVGLHCPDLVLMQIKYLYNFNNTNMMSLFPNMGSAVTEMKERVEQASVIKDNRVVPHVADLLARVDGVKSIGDVVHVSNIVKQTTTVAKGQVVRREELPVQCGRILGKERACVVSKLEAQQQKLKWAGFGLPREEVYLIDRHLAALAEDNKAEEVRFWGKIMGTLKDYYIVQGRTHKDGGLQDVVKGAEKRGEGVNYWSFWVSNNLFEDKWVELPLVTPEHIKVSRKVKKAFTGELFKPVISSPAFNAEERFYLKAQLVRMTSSLQIVPKGIFKPNDDNPKLTEYEDEAKIPEFAELSAAETWVHRNPNLLNLGRCTHWVDPATPEDQLETVTAELAEKDPEIERLRGISEDKLPEGHPMGVQNIWLSKVVGDTQVFQKDEASSAYAVAVYRNVLWPGWTTVAYKGGFCNFYLGYGHKSTQPAWSQLQNANLAEEAEEVAECNEPTPAEEPKVVEEAPQEGEGEAD